ncbi:MAG: hypothetical protein DME15_05240 [Candidatus Rokuibacteriota bacterium]|nr:MAG: hypothetical protein DME15_05240 [Candidatus Rokubacteria bacterium]
MTRRFIGLLLALTLVATDAAAQTYRWVDEQGQVHYAGSREQVPEQYRPQLPPAEPAAPGPSTPSEPAAPGASTPAAPGASTPDASGRPPTLLAGECMLLIPGGTRRPHDSRSYPNCDECRKAVEGLGADQAARASCIPLGQ